MISKSEAQFFKNKRVFITGGTGYLGTAILKSLCHCDCRCVVLGQSSSNSKRPGLEWSKKVTYFRRDISKITNWDSMVSNADIIIHLAAQTDHHFANENPKKDFEINVRPLVGLLEHCRKNLKKPAFVFASTSTIFGMPKSLPVSESHPDHPASVYDLHKLLAENYIKYYSHRGYIRGVSLRLTNVYGPGPYHLKTNRNVLNRFVTTALSGRPLSLFGRGTSVRDFVYIDDVVAGLLQACVKADRVSGGSFVLGSGRGHTLMNAAVMIKKAVENLRDEEVQLVRKPWPVKTLPIDKRNFIADPRRFQKLTGWKPKVILREGILKTISAQLENSL